MGNRIRFPSDLFLLSIFSLKIANRFPLAFILYAIWNECILPFCPYLFYSFDSVFWWCSGSSVFQEIRFTEPERIFAKRFRIVSYSTHWMRGKCTTSDQNDAEQWKSDQSSIRLGRPMQPGIRRRDSWLARPTANRRLPTSFPLDWPPSKKKTTPSFSTCNGERRRIPYRKRRNSSSSRYTRLVAVALPLPSLSTRSRRFERRAGQRLGGSKDPTPIWWRERLIIAMIERPDGFRCAASASDRRCFAICAGQ